MTVHLDPNLEAAIKWALHGKGRGLSENQETTSAIIRAIDEHFDRKAGEIDRQTRKRLIDLTIVDAAISLNVTDGILAMAFQVQLTNSDTILYEKISARIGTIATSEEIAELDTFNLLQVWIEGGGKVPSALVGVIESAEPLSRESWLAYLDATNSGNYQSQQELVKADLQAGCPALLLHHITKTEASLPEALQALNNIDVNQLQHRERWGDIASIAIALASRGWISTARSWSSNVCDEQILRWMSFVDQNHHRVLGPRIECSISNDARVFAPLALIDYLAGDYASAERRVNLSVELDIEHERFRYGFAAHLAMLDWVKSRLLSNAQERRSVLESIQPSHAELGILRAQISYDLAELARTDGDTETYDRMRQIAVLAMKSPNVELYVTNFPYDRLLRQLPCVESQNI